MYSSHILAMLDFSKIFIIQSDAFGLRLGVILIQEGRPLDFTNKELSSQL